MSALFDAPSLRALGVGIGAGLGFAALAYLVGMSTLALGAPITGGIADDPADCRCAAWLCG